MKIGRIDCWTSRAGRLFAYVAINTAADLPKNEQFIHRGFFQQLDGLAYPTVPYRMSASPVRLTRVTPPAKKAAVTEQAKKVDPKAEVKKAEAKKKAEPRKQAVAVKKAEKARRHDPLQV